MNGFQWWNPFTWNTARSIQDSRDPIKQPPRRPQARDWTDEYSVNLDLTRGLYHNSYPGFKLSGALAYPPIAVPIYLMGFPIPKGPEQLQEELNGIVKRHCDDFGMIHMCHRDATVWVYPYWSAEDAREYWEFIPDNTITDIIRDIRSSKIVAIITDEQLNVAASYNKTVQVRRRRTFTEQAVKVEWLEGAASLPIELKGGVFRNVVGVIPIPFANNRDGEDVRGHSDYERILSDLKNYHDTDLAFSENLVKFQPKMIQEVENADVWLKSNGFNTIADINIANIDFILNVIGREKTSFEFPERAGDAFEKKLKIIFWKLVQGSGIPELLWGGKVEGNMASADNQIDSVIQYVEDKQRQKNEAYKKLFEATLRVRGIALMNNQGYSEIEIKWNALELISEETKSTIFQNFASGIQSLIDSAGITKPQLWKLWKKLQPEITEDDIGNFVEGLSDMAKHKAFKDSPYENIIDLKEEDSEDIDGL